MKKTTDKKSTKRNDKAANILRGLDDKQLAAVAGGTCRTCGIMVSFAELAKAQ